MTEIALSTFNRLRPRSLNFNTATFLLMLSMFMTGGAGLVLEYIQGTIATYILGNSIEQFSLVIAVMLFMMGVASKVQSRISDKNLIEKFIIIEVCLAMLGGFSPLFAYWAFAYSNHFMLAQYFCIASLGFLIGLEIPVVLRINEQYQNKLSLNIDKVFSADYIGSLCGALLWVYILLKYFPLTESSFILAGLNFSVAIVSFLYFYQKQMISHKKTLSLTILLTAALLMVGYSYNRSWNEKMEQHMYDSPIVFKKTSRYQHLVMTHNSTLDEYRFYINGNLQFSSYDEERYHELLVHPAMSLVSHRKVLIIGGGDGMALREVLKYPDVEEVLLVDLDPAMTEFCKSNPVMRKLNQGAFQNAKVVTVSGEGVSPGQSVPLFMENGKVSKATKLPETEEVANISIMNIDADKFLRSAQGHWNLVIIDLPDPSSIELAKLYSTQFFQKVKRVMSETGAMVIQSTSPLLAKESYLMIGRTLRSAGFHILPYHENIESFGDWGWFLTWKNELSASYIPKKIEDIEIIENTRYLTAEVFKRALIFGKAELTSKYDTVNTMMWPKLLDVYLKECWKYD